jgi:hypothetical protein
MYPAYNNGLPIPTFAKHEEDQAEQCRKESEKWDSFSNDFSEQQLQ